MSMRMVIILALMILLKTISSFPMEQSIEEKSSDLEPVVKEQSVKEPSEPSMSIDDQNFPDSYILPPDNKQKVFGGDRSDEFLYPPKCYYERWAEEEREKDLMLSNMNNNEEMNSSPTP